MGLWGSGGISVLRSQANLLEMPTHTFAKIPSQGIFRTRTRCPFHRAQLCPGHRQLRIGHVSPAGAARGGGRRRAGSDPRCGRDAPRGDPAGMVPDGPGRAGLAPGAARAGRPARSGPGIPAAPMEERARNGRERGGEGETSAAAPPSGERLGEAGVKSRISMRAGLMQITATGSSRRKAKQLQPGLPSSALQPGEA